MKFLNKFLYTLLISQLTLIHQNKGQQLNYEFVTKDNYYSFTGNLFIDADPDCLLDLIYKFEHISKYSSGAKSIQLVQENENGYDVAFVYKKLLFIENESTWCRTLSQDKRKISFEMLSNETNIRWLPKIISSKGYYQITSTENSSLVEYYQECSLEHGALQDLYIRESKKEAIQFLEIFEEYLSNNCDTIERKRLIFDNNNQ